jgi:TolB-like protein
MQSSIGPDQVCFGRFRFDLRRCRLLHDDEPIELGGRALEVLRLLALANGAVVSKDELMTRLWRGRTVEENNLHVHISALRKALSQHGEGESYVITVPGRGYRLAHPNGSHPARASGSSPTQHPSLPDKPSIAVLPFANLSADPEQQYFVDGMVEEIITALSRIQWLFVIARNSSFIYKGQNINVTRIGSELGVHYVLEGSIRRAGDRVRITAQLIDAGSDAHLWADRFDGSLEDVFEIQDRVAARVAGAIEPALQAREIRRSGGRPTDDLSAYDLFL